MTTHSSVAIVGSAEKAAAVPLTPLKEVQQLTWLVKGHLKNEQIGYLRVGAILVRVQDKKLYAAYKNPPHPDMASYADYRLHLGKTSLYRYIRVYKWVAAFHPAWIQPHPVGFIPDLSAVTDLIWIEKELTRMDLEAKTRAALEELRRKALEGRLKQGEIDPFRRKHHGSTESLKSFLARLRFLRMSGAKLANMPVKVISDLDVTIEDLSSVVGLRRAARERARAVRRPAAKMRTVSRGRAR